MKSSSIICMKHRKELFKLTSNCPFARSYVRYSAVYRNPYLRVKSHVEGCFCLLEKKIGTARTVEQYQEDTSDSETASGTATGIRGRHY